MSYKTRPLIHFLAMQACVERWGVEASMSMRDFHLNIRARGREHRFFPQVTRRVDGRMVYSRRIDSGVTGFIGWLPYAHKQWPAGAAKEPFKKFCIDQGLRTPAYSAASPAGMAEFIVKRGKSSFGRGFQGPFRTGEPMPALEPHAYYEEFVRGRILKAWYWDEELLCIEADDFPRVRGDGRSKVRQLIEAYFPDGYEPEWETHERVASVLSGRSLDDVAPAGAEVLIDYRYGSSPVTWQLTNTNQLDSLRDSTAARELAGLGAAFLRTIPKDRRAGTLYSVDAIVDASDRVWLLEMNCNPMVHPDAYPVIFRSLFGEPDKVRAPAALLPVGAYLPPPAGTPTRMFRFA